MTLCDTCNHEIEIEHLSRNYRFQGRSFVAIERIQNCICGKNFKSSGIHEYEEDVEI